MSTEIPSAARRACRNGGKVVVVVVTSVIFAIYLWLADMIIVQLFRVTGS